MVDVLVTCFPSSLYYVLLCKAIRKTTATSRLYYCYSHLDVIIPALAPPTIILPMMWNPVNDCAPTVT
ncbi:hypothetical protein PILCRDRAFT_105690 [Piloderma croceum F 1598]|uniref:Uncharacterized protein n=1 Tax=Piloderma croceum (strain F 1598) TaxID=765440 RepID=A0A0C3G6R7_PILCF|nr:hypothetical protein PILCRDRAFT_105690 [Piloderma croceum F 1598]